MKLLEINNLMFWECVCFVCMCMCVSNAENFEQRDVIYRKHTLNLTTKWSSWQKIFSGNFLLLYMYRYHSWITHHHMNFFPGNNLRSVYWNVSLKQICCITVTAYLWNLNYAVVYRCETIWFTRVMYHHNTLCMCIFILYCPNGNLPMKIRVAFLEESQLQQCSATQSQFLSLVVIVQKFARAMFLFKSVL